MCLVMVLRLHCCTFLLDSLCRCPSMKTLLCCSNSQACMIDSCSHQEHLCLGSTFQPGTQCNHFDSTCQMWHSSNRPCMIDTLQRTGLQSLWKTCLLGTFRNQLCLLRPVFVDRYQQGKLGNHHLHPQNCSRCPCRNPGNAFVSRWPETCL